jgi:hypothetical protein
MSVLSGSTRLIFCEGEWDPGAPPSLDTRLLNRLLQGKPPTSAIQPAGGKYQLRAFMRGRLAAGGVAPNYIAFRDRDFDAEPPAAVSLIPYHSGEPIYMSHRSTVENYLIEVELIDTYWRQHAGTPRWQHGPSPGRTDIGLWMTDTARQLIAYQAARWALASVKPSERWPEIQTTWTKGSGHLPSSLDASSCLAAATALVTAFSEATGQVTGARLGEKYQTYIDRFSAARFLSDAEYLVWFQGKDLQKAMQKARPNSISLDHFLAWAVDTVDWTQHADLGELANKL